MMQMHNRIAERFWSATQDGGAGANTLTKAAETGETHYLVGFQCKGDAAAVVTVESPAATILWQKAYTAAFDVSEDFYQVPLEGADGSALIVKISAATADSQVNAQGFSGEGGS